VWRGVAILADGTDLDLDSKASDWTEGSGGSPEIAHRSLALRFFRKRARDSRFAGLVEELGAASWWRLTTDGGRTAWVQVLRQPRSPKEAAIRPLPCIVRWCVARESVGEPAAMPAPGFCVGRDTAIDVWFSPSPAYTKYRVERREPADDVFHPIGETRSPPFADEDTVKDRRYAYRVVGITLSGSESLPCETQGTTNSHGVTRGELELRTEDGGGPNGIDLVLGVACRDGADVVYAGSLARSAVRFRDFEGTRVEVPSSSWRPAHAWPSGEPDSFTHELLPAHEFCVPLRGGGVARLLYERVPNSYVVRVSFETFLDGIVMPIGPSLSVTTDDETSVRVAVDVPEGGRILSLTQRDLALPGAGPLELECADDGTALADLATGEVAEFSVICIDQYGRVGARSHRRVDRRADAPVDGTFELARSDGFSFDSQSVTRGAAADVVFTRAPGAGAATMLSSPFGVTTVERAVGRDVLRGSRDGIFTDLLAVDDGDVLLERTAHSRGLTAADVFVVRTRDLRWAKIVIDHRTRATRGNPARIVCRYSFLPRGSVFDGERPSVRRSGGLVLGVRANRVTSESDGE